MACFLLSLTRTVRTQTSSNEAKGSDVSGRTVIASAFLALTLIIGFSQPASVASTATSPGWIIPQVEPLSWRTEAGATAPTDDANADRPLIERAPSPIDEPSHDALASSGRVFDLFDVHGDLGRVRNILKSRLIDVPDFGQAVPDPNVLAIFGLGLLALGFIRRLIA